MQHWGDASEQCVVNSRNRKEARNGVKDVAFHILTKHMLSALYFHFLFQNCVVDVVQTPLQ